MKRYDCKQGTDEWLRLRLAIPTSSEFSSILTPKTAKLSKSATPYMHRLLAEWLVGTPLEDYESKYMMLGKEMEQEAVNLYAFEAEYELDTVGFITNDAGTLGCSPDRLIVGHNGGLEVKCHPQAPWIQVGKMLERAIDDDHKPQVQGQMYIAELDFVDVLSYCPGLPSVTVRARRDESYIKSLAEALDSFVEVMMKCREKLSQQYGPFDQRAIQRATAPDDGLGFDVTPDDISQMIGSGLSVVTEGKR